MSTLRGTLGISCMTQLMADRTAHGVHCPPAITAASLPSPKRESIAPSAEYLDTVPPSESVRGDLRVYREMVRVEVSRGLEMARSTLLVAGLRISGPWTTRLCIVGHQ